MRCADIREHLSAFQDGELPEDLRARVSEHLEHCPDCLDLLSEYGKLWSGLELLDDGRPEGDENFIEGVLSKTTGKPMLARVPPRALIPAIAAVAATVLLVAGLMLLGSLDQKGDLNGSARPEPVPQPERGMIELQQALTEDPELFEILDNLDALESMEILETLPVLENLEEIRAADADDLVLAAEAVVLEPDPAQVDSD